MGKSGRIGYGKIGQSFSVQTDTGALQSLDESAVGEMVHPRRCIDSDDPEPSEISLLRPSIAVSVHQGLIDRIGCRPKQFAPSAPESFGQLKYLFPAPSGFKSSFDSHRCALFSLSVGQKKPDPLEVGTGNDPALAQGPFAFGCFFGQYVAPVSLGIDIFARARLFKPFGGGTVGLDLRHSSPRMKWID